MDSATWGACSRTAFKGAVVMLDAPEDEAIDTARVARDAMEGAMRLSIPVVVETGIGRTWAEAH